MPAEAAPNCAAMHCVHVAGSDAIAVFYIGRTLRVFPEYFAIFALTFAFVTLHKPTSWIGEPLRRCLI
jgi:hypothetical protein